MVKIVSHYLIPVHCSVSFLKKSKTLTIGLLPSIYPLRLPSRSNKIIPNQHVQVEPRLKDRRSTGFWRSVLPQIPSWVTSPQRPKSVHFLQDRRRHFRVKGSQVSLGIQFYWIKPHRIKPHCKPSGSHSIYQTITIGWPICWDRLTGKRTFREKVWMLHTKIRRPKR